MSQITQILPFTFTKSGSKISLSLSCSLLRPLRRSLVEVMTTQNSCETDWLVWGVWFEAHHVNACQHLMTEAWPPGGVSGRLVGLPPSKPDLLVQILSCRGTADAKLNEGLFCWSPECYRRSPLLVLSGFSSAGVQSDIRSLLY